jgi:ABC-type lipoprotein release transport system permease subunit
VVFTNQDLIQLFGIPEGRAIDLSVEVFNDNEVATIAEKVKRLHPDTRPITRSEILRTYDAVFSWRSGMLLTVFVAALAAFCILAWDKATGISAEERREIGVLKALGWGTGDVLELKFWEGVAVSLTSFLLGLIAALLHVFTFGASLLSPVIQGWSVLYPDFRFTPSISVYQLCVLAFLTVVPYIASTVAPSWKAAITDPEEVMRG